MKDYGITNKKTNSSAVETHLENLALNGFSIAESVFEQEKCELFATQLEKVYALQKEEFGEENLQKINEIDLARMPFMYDQDFYELFMHPLVLEVTEKVLGKNYQLHLQNGIINRPEREHHQSSWHRDLPYQDWVCSKALGCNAFICISEFTTQNGATFVLPHSHQIDHFPSSEYVQKNEVQIQAPMGSIVFFDSMLYHRAGYNQTTNVRYGINNMFVVPILKQQIDLAANESLLTNSPKINQILGFDFQVPKNVKEYRQRKLNKVKN